jgi:hypothetical protein
MTPAENKGAVPPDQTARDAQNPPSGFPEPPGKDPGDISRDRSPHHVLNAPVGDPDATEYPDPYDRREDPLAPPDEQVYPGDGRSHTPTGATSNSSPVADADIETDRANALEGDDLDD